MPNGADRNLRRFYMACAFYRQRYDGWPSQARMHPTILRDIATLLDAENFGKLATLVEVRTCEQMEVSVGGQGVVRYSEIDHEALDPEMLKLAEEWAGVLVRRDARRGG